MIDAAGKLPPHDLDAEAACLSAVIVDNEHSIRRALTILDPEGKDFYSEANRRIFEAAVRVHTEQGGQPDVVRVLAWLKNKDRLAQVGGYAYVTEVLGAAPFVDHVEHYAKIVHDCARKRRMIVTCSRIAAEGYVGGDTAEMFLANAERDVAAITADTRGQDRGTMFDVSLHRVYEEVQKTFERGVPDGIPTGLHEYDDKTIGLHKKEVTIIAARPGLGKSALAFGIGINVAKTIPPLFDNEGKTPRRHGVGVFSLEMPADQFTMRALASEARVFHHRLRSGRLDAEDWSRLASTANSIEKLPIFIDDTANLHIDALRARVVRLKTEMERKDIGLDVVIVDYLQLLSGAGTDVRGREQEIAAISRGLRLLANEEDLALVVCAQLNRDVEKRADKRPTLSDLRESGSIEQDAHNIVFIYRPEFYGETVHKEEHGLSELIIAKQRHGPTGVARARWSGRFTRFDNFEETPPLAA